MEMANFFAAAVLALFGFVVLVFKAAGLIAGYNTSSPQVKATYDTDRLTRFVGTWLLIAAAVLFVGGLLSAATGAGNLPAQVSWAIFFVIVIGMAVRTNTGDRFRKER